MGAYVLQIILQFWTHHSVNFDIFEAARKKKHVNYQ